MTRDCRLDTSVAQFDHFHGRHRTGEAHVWPICNDCHDRKDRSSNDEAESFLDFVGDTFNAYQWLFRRRAGSQLRLL